MSGLRALLLLVVVLDLTGVAAGAQALLWETNAGFRSATVQPTLPGKTGFTLLPPGTTGVTFTNVLPPERHFTNQILLNGSGVAAGDVDGDGWCDLFFCGLGGGSRLFRNLGQWRFEDVTETAGVACPDLDCTGAILADLDGDGALDLVVNSLGGGTRVFHNDGHGHFTRSPEVLNAGRGGMSLAAGDVNGDGYLDVYVANYRVSGLMDMPNTRFEIKTINGRKTITRVNGRSVTEPDLAGRFVLNDRASIEEMGEVDVLYINQGGKSLSPVSFTGGMFLDEDGQPLTAPLYDWGLSVIMRDLNGDGWPDLYVCNDFNTPDRIWINNGRGQFRALPRLAMRKSCWFTMAADVADVNRDGYDDFVALDMLSRNHRHRMVTQPQGEVRFEIGEMDNRPQYSRNQLFLNRGDGTYTEIGQLAGLEATEWSWNTAFLDVDLDGWEDLLVATGNERDGRNMDTAARLGAMRKAGNLSNLEILFNRRIFADYHTPNLAFRNRHDLTFEDVSAAWGFNLRGVSHGLALADLDNDGDLDVVVNCLNAPAAIYRNDSPAPRVAVRLHGQSPNTRGIGARIEVEGGAAPFQSQEIQCGGRYLSSDDAMRVFAAGALTNDLRIAVKWRSGKRSVLEHARPNRIYEVDESAAVPSHPSLPVPVRPIFEDVSRLLQHVHVEEPFDDFARQRLLPNRLSQLGAGVAWFDLDGDGWDDLIVASGKGGELAAYRNDRQGRFQHVADPFLMKLVTRDQTAVLGWEKAPGQPALLVGSANYEDGLAVGPSVRLYDLRAKQVDETLPPQPSSAGPLALADVDGDGELDLFVGGRVVPGRYPEPASSLFFRGARGKFVLDEETTRLLAQVGLASGAVLTDLNGDGAPDLVLACEWGPVRVFLNERGRLTDATQRLGLARYTGWWTGVAAGDFDNDGRLDLVVANWGRNTKYQSHRGNAPLRLYYGDLAGDGGVQMIEAWFDKGVNHWAPERMLAAMAGAMPFLRERFPTYEAYGQASVEQILGDRLSAAKVLEVNWLETTVFLNRGDHFEARPLPVEAQMAPAFAVCVADVDGDGNEDIFLSQNFFATAPETPRYDGGIGLWLKGDGRGGFRALSGQETGVKVYGEQRGAAVCDYDQDGRVDLVVTQNGAETKLYHNQSAQPGLRVSLRGPPGNPGAVGAAIRLKFGTQAGPVREVRAGSGYWSQDSLAQVMGLAGPPTEVWVRWPGGKTSTTPVLQNVRTAVIDSGGVLRPPDPLKDPKAGPEKR